MAALALPLPRGHSIDRIAVVLPAHNEDEHLDRALLAVQRAADALHRVRPDVDVRRDRGAGQLHRRLRRHRGPVRCGGPPLQRPRSGLPQRRRQPGGRHPGRRNRDSPAAAARQAVDTPAVGGPDLAGQHRRGLAGSRKLAHPPAGIRRRGSRRRAGLGGAGPGRDGPGAAPALAGTPPVRGGPPAHLRRQLRGPGLWLTWPPEASRSSPRTRTGPWCKASATAPSP